MEEQIKKRIVREWGKGATGDERKSREKEWQWTCPYTSHN